LQDWKEMEAGKALTIV